MRPQTPERKSKRPNRGEPPKKFPDVSPTHDLTRVYLTSIGKHKLLSNDAEIELSQRIKRLREAYRHRLLAIPAVVRGVEDLLRQVSLRKKRLDSVIEVAVSDAKRVKQIRRSLPSLIGDLKTIEHAHSRDVALAQSQQLSDEHQQKVVQRIARRQKEIRQLLSDVPVRSEVLYDLYLSSKSVSSRCRRRIERLKHAYEGGKNRFVQHNLRLVVPIAKRYSQHGVSFLDLLQEGNAGLMRAADKFDPELGHRFSTYATWWINQAILHAIRTQSRVIRLPVTVIRQVTEIRAVSQQFIRDEQRFPQTDELAEASQQTYEQAAQTMQLLRKPTSIDDFNDDDEPIADYLPGAKGDEGLRAAGQEELCQLMSTAIRELNPREQRVVKLRYGLDDGHQRTLAEVGKKLSLSRESIRQIEAGAFRKLRKISVLWSLN